MNSLIIFSQKPSSHFWWLCRLANSYLAYFKNRPFVDTAADDDEIW